MFHSRNEKRILFGCYWHTLECVECECFIQGGELLQVKKTLSFASDSPGETCLQSWGLMIYIVSLSERGDDDDDNDDVRKMVYDTAAAKRINIRFVGPK